MGFQFRYWVRLVIVKFRYLFGDGWVIERFEGKEQGIQIACVHVRGDVESLMWAVHKFHNNTTHLKQSPQQIQTTSIG
jgi:hypothetical protein